MKSSCSTLKLHISVFKIRSLQYLEIFIFELKIVISYNTCILFTSQ